MNARIPLPGAAMLAPFVLSAVLAGCWAAPPSQTGYDYGADGCAENSAPEIGNLVLDSFCGAFEQQDEEEVCVAWVMTVQWDWIDPGGGGTDPPNMIGGYLSWEVSEHLAPSTWFTDEDIDPGATSGTLARSYTSEVWVDGSPVQFELRVRDRCGASSNEKAGSYEIGSGQAVEGGGEEAPAESLGRGAVPAPGRLGAGTEARPYGFPGVQPRKPGPRPRKREARPYGFPGVQPAGSSGMPR